MKTLDSGGGKIMARKKGDGIENMWLGDGGRVVWVWVGGRGGSPWGTLESPGGGGNPQPPARAKLELFFAYIIV
jgi:hypothetical protein